MKYLGILIFFVCLGLSMYVNKQYSDYVPMLQDYYSREREDLLRRIPAIKDHNKRFAKPDSIAVEVLELIESVTAQDAFSPGEREKIVSVLERDQIPFVHLQSNYSLLLTLIDNTPGLFQRRSEPGEYNILISSIAEYDSSFLLVNLSLFLDFKHHRNIYIY